LGFARAAERECRSEARGIARRSTLVVNLKMINTTEYKDIQATVIHRITDEINTEEVEIGIEVLVKILDKAVQKYGSINLIINAKGVRFSSLVAHKM